MSAGPRRSDAFTADFDLQYRWYLKEAGERIAGRYLAAVEKSLRMIGANPRVGRLRKFHSPVLREIRSLRVMPPFGAHLVFYRQVDDGVFVERVMHGARDMARRLLQPPGND